MCFRITLFLSFILGSVSSVFAQNSLEGKWELDSVYFDNNRTLNNISSKGYYLFTPKGTLKTKIRGLRPLTLSYYCAFEEIESKSDTCKKYIHERVTVKVIPEGEKKEESITAKCGYSISNDTLFLKSSHFEFRCYYLFSVNNDKLTLVNPRKKTSVKLTLKRKED